MTGTTRPRLILAALLLGALAPFHAPAPARAQFLTVQGFRLVEANQPRHVANGAMVVTPSAPWNRFQGRPSKRSELWTRDGLTLNELSFYTGIRHGEPLLRERSRRDQPLPKFDRGMLLADIPAAFEATGRIVTGSALFRIGEVAPAPFLGAQGVRFGYEYTTADNLVRRGEARAAIVGGQLHMITWEAPRLHYFDRDLAEARALMDGATLAQTTKR